MRFGPGGAARASYSMTISADRDISSERDRLERNLELYRDLTVALRRQITLLEAGDYDDDKSGKAVGDKAASHRKSLQTVLEIEASLAKRTKATDGGSGVELDLDAARAEIVERLAVWAARR